MVYVLIAGFIVVLVSWGGPIVLLFAERTRFLAPWLLALAVSGTAAAFAFGGADDGTTMAILSAPSAVAVLIYGLIRWGFRDSP
ncbi:hypothetical protein ACIQM4_28495 [Streptomyces sp. NPDC091272]|uniref:hypothetical protein n=1 Tax=Streptomyces sp. NPDC091272 TaxID=3365981 RepID=UPI003810E88A